METVNQDEIRIKEDHFKAKILQGEIFIHPTDTVYGIGCNAMDPEAVKKVRQIKGRDEQKPFSIIAPSVQWIKDNCIIDESSEKWLKKLPGPYTLILKLKKSEAVPPEVNGGRRSIGIRMPDHWITDVVAKSNVPIITSTANKSGEDYMTSIEDLDPDIKSRTDFIIYEGEKTGSPSTLVNLAGEEIESRKERDII